MEGGKINSCLYKATVMHHRSAPKKHSFRYEVFMFYLDFDEINSLASRLKFMSYNRFNLFSFRDRDHLQLPEEKPDLTKNIRRQITCYLLQQGVNIGNGRIMVLTNLCTLGYQFNPVSFYFCYNEADEPVCAIVEVCNTFREMKPYFLGADTKNVNNFRLHTGKYFYVSPFSDMDTDFDFNLDIPADKLSINIDDYDRAGNCFFQSSLIGQRKPLTDGNLLKYFFSMPLITLKVIGAIHWQAIKLWLKKLPYHKKSDNQDLQQDVYRPVRNSQL